MSNDDDLRDGDRAPPPGAAGEPMWPMPLPRGAAQARWTPTVADIANMGDRYGGMLVAGLFLKEFVAEGIRWAHLDIAGPAFNDGDAARLHPQGRHRRARCARSSGSPRTSPPGHRSEPNAVTPNG